MTAVAGAVAPERYVWYGLRIPLIQIAQDVANEVDRLSEQMHQVLLAPFLRQEVGEQENKRFCNELLTESKQPTSPIHQ
jgi:hypothetical protein